MAILFEGSDFATEYPEYVVEYGDTVLLRIDSDYYRAVMSDENAPDFLKSPAEHLCLDQKMNNSFVYDKSKVVIVEIYKNDIKSQYEELKKFFEAVIDKFYKDKYDEAEKAKEFPQYTSYDEYRDFCFTEYFETYNYDEGLFDEKEYRFLRRMFGLYYSVKKEYLIKYGVNTQWFADEFNCPKCGKENTITYMGSFFHEKKEQFLSFIYNHLPEEDIEYRKVIRFESETAVADNEKADEVSYENPQELNDEENEDTTKTEQDMVDVISAPYQLKKHATECPYCNRTLIRKKCICLNKKAMYEVELLYCNECKCYYTNRLVHNNITCGTAKPANPVTNIIKRQDKTGFATIPHIPKSIIVWDSTGEQLESYRMVYGEEELGIKINPVFQDFVSNIKINGKIISFPFTIKAQDLHSSEVDTSERYRVRFNFITGGIKVYTVNEGSFEKINNLSTVERGSKLYIDKDEGYARESGRIVENVMVNGKNVNLPYVHIVDGVVNISATYTDVEKKIPAFKGDPMSVSVNVVSPRLKLTSDKIKVYRNGIPVKSGSILQPGELLSVQCVNNARLKILYNGSLIRTPHVITVGNSDVVIELVNSNESAAVKSLMSEEASGAVHEDLQLNASSFLGDLGYSTSLSTSARYEILQKAVRMYGKTKVKNFLEYLIRGKLAQINGAVKYQNAISTWRYDINRINNM